MALYGTVYTSCSSPQPQAASQFCDLWGKKLQNAPGGPKLSDQRQLPSKIVAHVSCWCLARDRGNTGTRVRTTISCWPDSLPVVQLKSVQFRGIRIVMASLSWPPLFWETSHFSLAQRVAVPCLNWKQSKPHRRLRFELLSEWATSKPYHIYIHISWHFCWDISNMLKGSKRRLRSFQYVS